jgi:Flp pilus assembly protein TadD
VTSLKKKLEALRSSQTGPEAASGQAVADPKTREALKSLGYIVSPVPASKPAYGAQDDLKSFLPYQQQLERAILLGDAGRDDESAREFEALLRAKEHFVPAYIHFSQLQMVRGRVAEGLRILEEGVRVNPNDYPLLTEYGRALLRAGRFSDAVGVLERAIAGIDFDPDSWADLGRARVRVGAAGPALEAFERALALDPSSAPVHADVGALRLNRYRGGGGDPEDLNLAIRAFEKAAALNPALNAAFRGLGYAYLIAGRPAQALSAWARAVAIQPDDDFSSFNLGLLYLETGDKAAAKRLFSALLERGGAALSPSDRERLTALIERCK